MNGMYEDLNIECRLNRLMGNNKEVAEKKRRAGKRAEKVRRAKRKVEKPVKRPVKPTMEPPRGELEPVKVSKTDYKHVEGFCRVCGAKIYGDLSLIYHALEHDRGVTASQYASMSEDSKFKVISELASKLLTATEPKWYRMLDVEAH
jgi:hypothetical protein